MTISVGSYEDLEPTHEQPIDRNPTVQCHECTNSQDWKTWQEQYGEITPETKLRCAECWGELIQQAQIERKAKRNHGITEYA